MRALAPAVCLGLMLVSFQAAAASSELDQQLAQSVMYMDGPSVNALLAKGADANAVERDRSVLGWAAQNGNVEIVEALLKAGADVNFIDGVGHTPLMRAIDLQQMPVAQALLKARPDLSIRTRDGKTVAMMAVDSGKSELVKLLLEAGADFNAATPDGDTPAMVAVQGYGDEMYDIIKLLGEHKVDFNHSNPAYTPLVFALEQDNRRLITALLEAGADPNTPTSSGQLPLAVAMSNPEMVRLLLQAGADPNTVDGHGNPLLFAAMDSGSADSLNALIKAGADLNKRDRSERTPLEYADSMYLTEMAEILKAAGAGQGTASTAAVAEEPTIQSSGAPRNAMDAVPKLRMVQEMQGIGLEASYFSGASVRDLMVFYRKELPARGWHEADSNSDDLNYAVMNFQKDAERLSLTLSLGTDHNPPRVLVSLVPLGSMSVASLPRYAGTSTLFEQENMAIYVTPDQMALVGAETLKMLQAAGWQGKVTAENQDMRHYTLHKDGHELTAYIAVAPAQGNQTTIQYSLRKE